MLMLLIAVFDMARLTSAAMNVMGGPLATCSKPGTALTGFTRDGRCMDVGNDDDGSHHICIQMKPDFCAVTGQPNWCAEKMQCMAQDGVCAIGNWCVCQWAFAEYIQMAGGCDAIVNIVCDATNMATLSAYKSMPNDPNINIALQCLQQRCNLPTTQSLSDAKTTLIERQPSFLSHSSQSLPPASGFFLVLGSLGMALAWSVIRGQRFGVVDDSANQFYLI